MKLNVDGNVSKSHGKAMYGGLLRDHDGTWIAGFNDSPGMVDIIMAELKAIQMGFCLAWQRGFHNIVCESDSMEAIQLSTSLAT